MGTSVTFEGDDGHVRSTLVGAHRDRHSAGRQRTKDKKETVAKLREQGQTAHADRLDEVHTRRTHAAIQRARRQDELQAKRRWGPIRAKVNELPKVSGKLRRARYNREDFGTGGIREPVCVGARDLYVQFIPRGLKSGSSRNYKDGKPKPAGNRSPWKSGETGDKIQYICREEALEDVPGAVISNMGSNLRERVACGMAIERLEELGRADAGVYRHVIVALPHELAPEERVALLSRLVKPVGDLKLPFTASLHKPDKDGDERNYHAHIVFSLRPFERKEPTAWEFAASKLTWIETPAAHLLIRRHVAREFNRALKKAKVETRWTHLSRAARSEPSPGNTKRHRSDIRGDRALEAAEQNEQAAKRHLRLVAAVQSCVEAIGSEAVRLAGAAVSRSAFLGRVIALLEGSDADRQAESRRQRNEHTKLFERRVAAEVAAEALRARALELHGSERGERSILSASLAPLIEHFRDDKQVKSALAFKLSGTAVTAAPQGLGTIDPRPRDDTSANRDVVLPASPRVVVDELARPVATHGSVSGGERDLTGPEHEPLQRASASLKSAPPQVPVDASQNITSTVVRSEPPSRETVEEVIAARALQQNRGFGREVSREPLELDHTSRDAEERTAVSLPPFTTSKGINDVGRIARQRRSNALPGAYDGPRRGYLTRSPGGLAAAAKSVVPKMPRSSVHDDREAGNAGRDRRLFLPIFSEGHLEPGGADGDSLRRVGIVAGLLEGRAGIIESITSSVESVFDVPQHPSFPLDGSLAVAGTEKPFRAGPPAQQTLALTPAPVEKPMPSTDDGESLSKVIEVIPSPRDTDPAGDRVPALPEKTAIPSPLRSVAEPQLSRTSEREGVDTGTGRPLEDLRAQGQNRPVVTKARPISGNEISPKIEAAVLDAIKSLGSKCVRRVDGKLKLNRNAFSDDLHPYLANALNSVGVKTAISEAIRVFKREEEELQQTYRLNDRGRGR